jgi:hypothetical protein
MRQCWCCDTSARHHCGGQAHAVFGEQGQDLGRSGRGVQVPVAAQQVGEKRAEARLVPVMDERRSRRTYFEFQRQLIDKPADVGSPVRRQCHGDPDKVHDCGPGCPVPGGWGLPAPGRRRSHRSRWRGTRAQGQVRRAANPAAAACPIPPNGARSPGAGGQLGYDRARFIPSDRALLAGSRHEPPAQAHAWYGQPAHRGLQLGWRLPSGRREPCRMARSEPSRRPVRCGIRQCRLP